MTNYPHLKPLTKEQMEEGRKASAIARELRKKDYKQDYSCEPLWVALAERFNVKLPRGHLKAPTSLSLMKFATQLGLTQEQVHVILFGDSKGSLVANIKKQQARLGEGNKESLRAMCGYILEGIA